MEFVHFFVDFMLQHLVHESVCQLDVPPLDFIEIFILKGSLGNLLDFLFSLRIILDATLLSFDHGFQIRDMLLSFVFFTFKFKD